jgi:HEPN domain-containing protein
MMQNKEQVIAHWIESSNEDQETMQILYNSKKYAWALFIGHIAIEKLLKAIYISKFSRNAPFTHNLYRLAEESGLVLTPEIADKLDFITTFNIEARYDDYKKEFFSLCTPEFTEIWLNNILELIKWLRKAL